MFGAEPLGPTRKKKTVRKPKKNGDEKHLKKQKKDVVIERRFSTVSTMGWKNKNGDEDVPDATVETKEATHQSEHLIKSRTDPLRILTHTLTHTHTR